MIKLVNVSKKFKQEAVLKSINLELPRYGLIAIVGPSGCGKSSLLNCLGGLLKYEGNIIIDDTDISKLNDEKKSAFRLRRNVPRDLSRYILRTSSKVYYDGSQKREQRSLISHTA